MGLGLRRRTRRCQCAFWWCDQFSGTTITALLLKGSKSKSQDVVRVCASAPFLKRCLRCSCVRTVRVPFPVSLDTTVSEFRVLRGDLLLAAFGRGQCRLRAKRGERYRRLMDDWGSRIQIQLSVYTATTHRKRQYLSRNRMPLRSQSVHPPTHTHPLGPSGSP